MKKQLLSAFLCILLTSLAHADSLFNSELALNAPTVSYSDNGTENSFSGIYDSPVTIAAGTALYLSSYTSSAASDGETTYFNYATKFNVTHGGTTTVYEADSDGKAMFAPGTLADEGEYVITAIDSNDAESSPTTFTVVYLRPDLTLPTPTVKYTLDGTETEIQNQGTYALAANTHLNLKCYAGGWLGPVYFSAIPEHIYVKVGDVTADPQVYTYGDAGYDVTTAGDYDIWAVDASGNETGHVRFTVTLSEQTDPTASLTLPAPTVQFSMGEGTIQLADGSTCTIYFNTNLSLQSYADTWVDGVHYSKVAKQIYVKCGEMETEAPTTYEYGNAGYVVLLPGDYDVWGVDDDGNETPHTKFTLIINTPSGTPTLPTIYTVNTYDPSAGSYDTELELTNGATYDFYPGGTTSIYVRPIQDATSLYIINPVTRDNSTIQLSGTDYETSDYKFTLFNGGTLIFAALNDNGYGPQFTVNFNPIAPAAPIISYGDTDPDAVDIRKDKASSIASADEDGIVEVYPNEIVTCTSYGAQFWKWVGPDGEGEDSYENRGSDSPWRTNASAGAVAQYEYGGHVRITQEGAYTFQGSCYKNGTHDERLLSEPVTITFKFKDKENFARINTKEQLEAAVGHEIVIGCDFGPSHTGKLMRFYDPEAEAFYGHDMFEYLAKDEIWSDADAYQLFILQKADGVDDGYYLKAANGEHKDAYLSLSDGTVKFISDQQSATKKASDATDPKLVNITITNQQATLLFGGDTDNKLMYSSDDRKFDLYPTDSNTSGTWSNYVTYLYSSWSDPVNNFDDIPTGADLDDDEDVHIAKAQVLYAGRSKVDNYTEIWLQDLSTTSTNRTIYLRSDNSAGNNGVDAMRYIATDGELSADYATRGMILYDLKVTGTQFNNMLFGTLKVQGYYRGETEDLEIPYVTDLSTDLYGQLVYTTAKPSVFNADDATGTITSYNSNLSTMYNHFDLPLGSTDGDVTWAIGTDWTTDQSSTQSSMLGIVMPFALSGVNTLNYAADGSTVAPSLWLIEQSSKIHVAIPGIEEGSEPTSLADLLATPGVKLFTPAGLAVDPDHLSEGIYIVRTPSGKTCKVAIR